MEQLLELDKTLTLEINGCHSPFFDAFFYTYTKTAVWIPLLLLLFVLIYKQWRTQGLWIILFIGLSILLSDQISSSIIKPLVARLRPTHDPDMSPLIHTVNNYRSGLYGFLSSHAANTFAVVTLLTLVFKRTGFAIAFYLWAFFTAYSRVYLGVHFAGDVFCGAILGSFIGLLLYYALVYITPFAKHQNSWIQLDKQFNTLLVCALVLNVLFIAVFC